MTLYRDDLAFIHDAGFSGFARETAPALLSILRESGATRGLVTDLGCGSGVWSRRLLRAGYEVLGADPSAAMIELARRRSPAARFEVATFEELALPRSVAITAIGEVFNYVAMPPEDAFRKVRAALDVGGVFLFDVAIPGEHYEGSWSGEDWEIFVSSRSDESTLTRHIITFRMIDDEARRSEETHVLRLHDPTRTANALRACGFEVTMHDRYGRIALPAAHMAFHCVAT